MEETNRKANVGILIYAVVITFGGVGVMVASYLFEWGFMGYLGGGIFAVAGGGMLVSKLRGGLGYMTLSCPECGTSQTWAEEAFDAGRVAPCTSCLAYMQRSPGGPVVLVSKDVVYPEPMFEAPCPKELSWNGCALCGQPPSGAEEVQGQVRSTAIVASIRTTRTIGVPVCGQHSGQHAVALLAGQLPGDGGFSLVFRSYAQCLAFRQRNPMATQVQGNLTFGRG